MVELWLARETGRLFFKESRLASLVATISRKHQLNVVDWGSNPAGAGSRERFCAGPDGVAAALYAEKLFNPQRIALPVSGTEIRDKIIDGGGYGEVSMGDLARGDIGKSLTIYAFDMADPIPIALARTDEFASFRHRFLKQRRLYLEHGLAKTYFENTDADADFNLTQFIYETFQNTFRHGRRDRHHRVIEPSLRFLRLKRHLGSGASEFSKQAEGFPELQEYFAGKIKARKQAAFYEVSVGDHGLGIVNRFVATRPEFAKEAQTVEEQSRLINKIILNALSSNSTHPGAGHGLRNALRAVDSLQGFVSLRSGKNWLYRSSFDKNSEGAPFKIKQVSADLPETAGTKIDMIFPLTV